LAGDAAAASYICTAAEALPLFYISIMKRAGIDEYFDFVNAALLSIIVLVTCFMAIELYYVRQSNPNPEDRLSEQERDPNPYTNLYPLDVFAAS